MTEKIPDLFQVFVTSVQDEYEGNDDEDMKSVNMSCGQDFTTPSNHTPQWHSVYFGSATGCRVDSLTALTAYHFKIIARCITGRFVFFFSCQLIMLTNSSLLCRYKNEIDEGRQQEGTKMRSNEDSRGGVISARGAANEKIRLKYTSNTSTYSARSGIEQLSVPACTAVARKNMKKGSTVKIPAKSSSTSNSTTNSNRSNRDSCSKSRSAENGGTKQARAVLSTHTPTDPPTHMSVSTSPRPHKSTQSAAELGSVRIKATNKKSMLSQPLTALAYACTLADTPTNLPIVESWNIECSSQNRILRAVVILSPDDGLLTALSSNCSFEVEYCKADIRNAQKSLRDLLTHDAVMHGKFIEGFSVCATLLSTAETVSLMSQLTHQRECSWKKIKTCRSRRVSVDIELEDHWVHPHICFRYRILNQVPSQY